MEDKKTVFISQPMADKPKELIKEERAGVVAALEELGYEAIDTVFAGTPEAAKQKPVYFLSLALMALSKCDYAYFMNGWKNARGCKIEYDICVAYGIPILNE